MALTFNQQIIMAPMSGVNAPSFCEMLRRRFGCDFIYTGLLTSHGIVRMNKKTAAHIHNLPGTRHDFTLIGQIFGAVPDIMARAAAKLEAVEKFAAIDINMGCPAPKVTKGAGGSALMKNPQLAADIVRAVSHAVSLPVTVKLRSGWDEATINFMEVAQRCVDAGAAAVALHPRTRCQRFTGGADWDHIAQLKQALTVPVIGSGDIGAPEDAKAMFEHTGCDAAMIGRACCTDPWLIGRTRRFLETGAAPPPADPQTCIHTALEHLDLHVELEGPERGVREMRRFIAWYIRGMPGASAVRHNINRAPTRDQMHDILVSYKDHVIRAEGAPE